MSIPSPNYDTETFFETPSKEQQQAMREKTPIARDNIAIFIRPTWFVQVRKFKMEDLADNREYLKKIEAFFGISISDDDFLVKFLAVDRSSASSNSDLSKHGYTDEEGKVHRFPIDIPLSLIRDKQEGDFVKINGSQGTFTFQCLQEPYRYGGYGRFEDVLAFALNQTRE